MKSSMKFVHERIVFICNNGIKVIQIHTYMYAAWLVHISSSWAVEFRRFR